MLEKVLKFGEVRNFKKNEVLKFGEVRSSSSPKSLFATQELHLLQPQHVSRERGPDLGRRPEVRPLRAPARQERQVGKLERAASVKIKWKIKCL